MGDRTTDHSIHVSRETVNCLPRSRFSSRLKVLVNKIMRLWHTNEHVQGGIHHQCISLTPKPSVPHKVFLGPFHDHRQSQVDRSEIKRKVLKRYFNSHLDRHFEELLTNMRRDQLMRRIRDWYHDWHCRCGVNDPPLPKDYYSDHRLAKIMTEGIFLLEFLRGLRTRYARDFSNADGHFLSLDQQFAVEEDVMKIDNQIPMFVLQKILDWEVHAYQSDPDNNEKSLIHQPEAATEDLGNILNPACGYLSPIRYKSDNPNLLGIAGVQWQDDMHLLEFVYENIIRSSDFANPNKRRKKKKGDNVMTLPTAAQLSAKGVKYDCNKGLLNEICFYGRNRTLYLPAIEMVHRTDFVLRNLLTFEYYRRETKPLMCYVDLMDRLINGANDVEVLRTGGIIESHLGSDDEVAGVWNRMRELVDKNNRKYEPIDNAVDDVIAFYTSKRRTLYTEFKRKYCSKPWIVLSVISACILLVLTILQTLLSWEQVRLQLQSMKKT